jgi:hypothetical protein
LDWKKYILISKLPPFTTTDFFKKANKFKSAKGMIIAILLITYLALFENTKNGYLPDIKTLIHEIII